MYEGAGILTRSPNLQFKEFFLYRQRKDAASWNDKQRSERIRAEQTAIAPSSASQILPGWHTLSQGYTVQHAPKSKMLPLKGKAGRASPETAAWPCDSCLSLGSVENEGTVLNLHSHATVQNKKRKQSPNVPICEWSLPGETMTDLFWSHTRCWAVCICFTLENSQWELITAFLTAGVGAKGLWLHSRDLAGPYISELLLHYASDTIFRSQGKLAFQVKVPGEKCLAFPAKHISSGSQTQQGPSLLFPASRPQTQMV